LGFREVHLRDRTLGTFGNTCSAAVTAGSDYLCWLAWFNSDSAIWAFVLANAAFGGFVSAFGFIYG
jgi:hypothetical protein